MRKCKFKEWNHETKSYNEDIGWFHQWGSDFKEYESGPSNVTLGIIERDDGRVVAVHLENITFLDKPGEIR
jgi:hypothetical protein